MKYPYLIEETGLPADVRAVTDRINDTHLVGTVTFARGHRGQAQIELRQVDHPLAVLFFEAERHFYCLDCYSTWHCAYHAALGDPYFLRGCTHDLNPTQWFRDDPRHVDKAERILAEYATQSLYPDPPAAGTSGEEKNDAGI